MPSSKRLLIIVAFNEEYKAVKKILKFKAKKGEKGSCPLGGEFKGHFVDIIMTSMGMEFALKTTTEKLKRENHGGVLVLGFCGGLSLALKNRDVIIPNKVISSKDQFVYEVESDLIEALGKIIISEGLRYRAVPMITENKVIETSLEKEALFRSSRAEAVDMETSEVMRVAQLMKVPACALKVVIDDCETELPRFNEIFKKTGRMDQLSIGAAMMTNPSLAMRLSNNMKQASQVIDAVLPAVIEHLCQWWQI